MKAIGCVIMAAGNSSRFPGNKLTAEFEGQPLFRRALEAVPPGVFSQVAVVTQYQQIADAAAEYGFHFLLNDRPEEGQSRTVVLGTQALQNCDAILFLVADQPLLRRETVRKVAEHWLAHPEYIVGAAHKGKRGNPCIFPKKFFPELLNLTGDVGGNAVIRAHPEYLRTVEVDSAELADIDTREALEALLSSEK